MIKLHFDIPDDIISECEQCGAEKVEGIIVVGYLKDMKNDFTSFCSTSCLLKALEKAKDSIIGLGEMAERKDNFGRN